MIYKLPNTEKGLAQANEIRDAQIAKGAGCLLIREDCDGHPIHLLEKIIAGDRLVPGVFTAEQIRWKPDSVVIFIGKSEKLLDEFEQLVPGFKRIFK